MDTFITLGRIFDQGSPHNLDRLFQLARDNREMFSKGALGRRRGLAGADEVVSRAYEPVAADFRRLRKEASRWRTVYETKYADLRRKIYAHRELSDNEQISALFAKTKVGELERLFAFLGSLCDALWELYVNGREPRLAPQRRFINDMMEHPSNSSHHVHERIVWEADEFLRTAKAGRRAGAL